METQRNNVGKCETGISVNEAEWYDGIYKRTYEDLNKQIQETYIASFVRGVISCQENLHGDIEKEKCFGWKVTSDNRGFIIHFEWINGQYDDGRADPTLGGEPKYEKDGDPVYIPKEFDFNKAASDIADMWERAFKESYFYKNKSEC